MKKNIIFKNQLKENSLNKEKKKLKKIIEEIKKSLDSKKDTLHTLSKKFKLNFNSSDLKKFQKFNHFILIGMGGSVLGAKAIYSFLKIKIKKEFIFIDNIDLNKINFLKNKKKLNNSCFIIISKSGNTLETLTNLNLLNNKVNSKNTIIITENKNNLLRIYSNKKKIFFIEHKNYIGGRYSVLSEVGMVPAILMGLNIYAFRKKLLTFLYSNQNSLIESVVKLSKIYNSKKFNSLIFLNYAPELNDFLYWCQQLSAESLGKKSKGLLPVVSPAPRDHHSLLQLYLDGPRDKLFCVFSLNHNKKLITNRDVFDKSFNYAQGKELAKISLAQKNALIKELRNKKMPYREFEINNINEQTLGELFSFFILETILIGKMININPFDQPAVEAVKILTKKYLS